MGDLENTGAQNHPLGQVGFELQQLVDGLFSFIKLTCPQGQLAVGIKSSSIIWVTREKPLHHLQRPFHVLVAPQQTNH